MSLLFFVVFFGVIEAVFAPAVVAAVVVSVAVTFEGFLSLLLLAMLLSKGIDKKFSLEESRESDLGCLFLLLLLMLLLLMAVELLFIVMLLSLFLLLLFLFLLLLSLSLLLLLPLLFIKRSDSEFNRLGTFGTPWNISSLPSIHIPSSSLSSSNSSPYSFSLGTVCGAAEYCFLHTCCHKSFTCFTVTGLSK